MSDVHFPLTADADFDDLPRTVRREKEARAKEARAAKMRERERREREEAARLEPTFDDDLPACLSRQRPTQPVYGDEPVAAAVQRFDVSFAHLVFFFFKAAIAAVPAAIILAVALFYIAKGAAVVFPDLATMKIIVSFAKG